MPNATDIGAEMPPLNCYDYIRTAAVVVMFITMTFYDRRTWVLADIFGSVLMGVFHWFYPQIYIKQHIGEDAVDSLMCYIVQIFCCFLVSDGIFRILVRKSRDSIIVSTLVWSRVVTVTLMFMFGIYMQLSPKFYLRNEHFSFVLFGTAVWLVSGLVQLGRYVSPLGGVEKSGVISWLLRLEFFVGFVFGLAHLAYPGWLLGFQIRRANMFHRFLVRMVGAFRIGSAFTAQQATSFRYERDIRAFCIGRVLFHVFVAICLVYQFLYEDIFNKRELLASCGLFIQTLPCLLALVISYAGWDNGKKSDKYSSSYSSSYYTRSKTTY